MEPEYAQAVVKRSRSVSDVDSREASPDKDSLFVSEYEPSKRVATEANGVSKMNGLDQEHENVLSSTNSGQEEQSGTPTLAAEAKGVLPTESFDQEHARILGETKSDQEREIIPPTLAIEANIVSKTKGLDQAHDGESRETSSDQKREMVSNEGANIDHADKTDALMLDEHGRVPGYDASKERLPACAPYLPSFKQVEDIVEGASDIVINAYQETARRGYHNTAIELVCGGLEGSRSPSDHYPACGPIAVLGPAGSGKSSATNSIMNQQKVAFEHDGDDRGTYLVHEYRAAMPDQVSKYRVVATFLSEDDIVRDIVLYYADINAHIFDNPDEPSEDESATEQKYKTAICFFNHLLAHRKEFHTEEATVEYFQDNGDEIETVCGNIYGFVKEFLESREAYADGEERYDVNTESDLHDIFKHVCRPPKSRGLKAKTGSPWPIIRKIAVHQSVQILDRGVVLADTPGFNDQNLAVVQNTMRYLKAAGTVLIFLHYKRIDQNSPLDELLRECIALGKMHKIRLVITCIDEMKAMDKEDLDAESRAHIEKAELNLSTILFEIKGTETAKKQAKGVDSARFEEMDGRLESLQLSKVKASAAVKQATIETRCRDLQNTLKGRIKTIDKSKHAPELPISFISNTQYQLHINGYDPTDSDTKETPFLDLKATGVTQLRQHLLTIPCYGKLQVLRGLVMNRLPNVFNGITGILTKSKLERIAEVRKIITKVFSKHRAPASDLMADILFAFDKVITTNITRNLPDWKDQAEHELLKWAEMKSGTFKGFCSRSGKWEGHKTEGGANWRNDLIKISAGKLLLAFNKLDGNLDGIKKDFSLDLQEIFGSICDNIKNSKDAQGNVLDPFFDFVHGVAVEIAEQMVAELDKVKSKVEQCRHAATLEAETSYFLMGMEDTYRKAQDISTKNHVPRELPAVPSANGKRMLKKKKTTLKHARMELILSKLRGESGEKSIFLSVGQLARDDLMAFMKDWSKECNRIIENGYGKIITYFENHFQEDEVKEEDDPEAVEMLKNAVEEATELLKTAEPLIVECEAYEKASK